MSFDPQTALAEFYHTTTPKSTPIPDARAHEPATDESSEELESLVKRIETILDDNYLGMSHAEIGRIVERALQILASRQKGR